MAKHQLSQKDMGYITLFAISLCTTQVHAEDAIAPLAIDDTQRALSAELQKPKINFSLEKKTVEDIPEQLEKPRFKLFQSKSKISKEQVKEQVLVPKVIERVPDLDDLVENEIAQVNTTPLSNSQSQNESKEKTQKKSFFAFVKREKAVSEPKVLQPKVKQDIEEASAPNVLKPTISSTVQPATKDTRQVLKPLKPKIHNQPTESLIEAQHAKLLENETSVSEDKTEKPKSKLFSFIGNIGKDKTKLDEGHHQAAGNASNTKVLTPTLQKSVNESSLKVSSTPKPKIVNDQQINGQNNLLQAPPSTVAQVEHRQSLVSKAKAFWPFKSGSHNKIETQNVIERPNLIVQQPTSALAVNKPTIVYSKPIEQKAKISEQSQSIKPVINIKPKADQVVSEQKYNTVNAEPQAKKKFSLTALKSNMDQFFKPKADDDFRQVKLNELSDFSFDPKQVEQLPVITTQASPSAPVSMMPLVNGTADKQTLSLYDAIKIAVARHPEVTQSVSSLASQNAFIDVAKAGYYPQLSAGVSTGDMTSGERGRQLFNVNATQLLFDFGKQKSLVSTEEAKLQFSQAQVLVTIDQIALEVASAIVNIKRYEEITRIAREQIAGISRIREIANLRAEAGISSQADPIQAQSYYESAQSNLILQETQLNVFKQRLRTLMGTDISKYNWEIPESLIKASDIYSEPKFNEIPKMMAAKAEVDVAELEKKQTQLSRYPTLNVKGTLSQAVNGRNPNNNQDDGTDSSIMLEANSTFFQGGAISSRNRAASFAEEAAKAKVNAVYLETIDEIRRAQEQVENKQRQMKVLIDQQATSVRTKELYQEQYKLGTRTAVDLLNAEQAIHRSNSDIETARYDIYENLVQYIAASGKSRDVYQLNNLTIQGVELKP